ncbi:MAG: DUF4390 domain-containing protein [Acidobacteriota bacterium]
MKLALAVAAAGLAAVSGSALADGPTLEDVRAVRDGDTIRAFARLQGGLTPKILDEIAAGLETTIGYRLHLYRRRPGLPDQALIKDRIRHTVRRDALTREYSLTRRVNGEVQQTRVTSDEREMREFMTVLDGVPLGGADLLSSGQDYYLKAKAELGLVWRFYLIPWPLDTAWVRVPIGPDGGTPGVQGP